MNLCSKFLLFLNTAKHLHLSQIINRLWRRKKVKITFDKVPNVAPRLGHWKSHEYRSSVMPNHNEFCFLNSPKKFEGKIDWVSTDQDPLWIYNLHYFNDLIAERAADRLAWHENLIDDWIESNPVGQPPGWDPYPTSIRIVNWIKWSVGKEQISDKFKRSICLQARWLSKTLEKHLLANHLFTNAKALIFAGFFFSGEEGDKWLTNGLRILDEQLDEQILEDGGHFERSPMYHSIILEDLIDIKRASEIWPARQLEKRRDLWSDKIARMLWWLDNMSHPDGEIAFFNDSAAGIGLKATDCRVYAGKVPEIESSFLARATNGSQPEFGICHMHDSGYIRVHQRTCQFTSLLDVARVGPDYNPGHTHADTLSFELSIGRARFIVNGGTSSYWSDRRQFERSTASHSTVEVNGKSSSEVWSNFRVARRAYPFGLQIRKNDENLMVKCSHNGYKRLRGKPVHERQWIFFRDSLSVNDFIIGQYKLAISRFIFHPNVSVKRISNNIWSLEVETGKPIIAEVKSGNSSIEESTFSPYFGKTLDTLCLTVSLENGFCSVNFLSK